MTASMFASLLKAKRTGKGKWKAKCPAHQEKTASLYITAGKDGGVWPHCYAGCSQKEILAAMGLTVADLYDRPLDRDTLRKIHLEDERRARVDAELHRIRLEALDRASMWGAVRDKLGGILATHEDDLRLGHLFAYAIAQERLWESRIDALDLPHLRGLGVPKLRREITVQDVGAEIAQRLGIRR